MSAPGGPQALVLADGEVGAECLSWLIRHHDADLGLVVTTTENAIAAEARQAGVATMVYESGEQLARHVGEMGLQPAFGLLLWWPRIIPECVIDLASHGFVNTHPSLLPHNRGKHYNFWALVEQAPFGVTLHQVEKGVDSGAIIAQTPLAHGWEDTGQTLYLRAREAMVALVKESYPALRSWNVSPVPQDLSQGSFHRARELEPASLIALDAPTTARDLLNRLRARTFPGYPGCRFEDNGRTFEVTVSIKDVT
jgi:methionyl-tRNA formyltransferase